MSIRALKIWKVTIEAIQMICRSFLAISLLLLLVFRNMDILIVTLFIAAATVLCTLILLSIKEAVKNRTYSQRKWYYED
tara:strand:+ start:982 stop:1218 length:237 start_codon:yes stop_codon:yes gene_type:complete